MVISLLRPSPRPGILCARCATRTVNGPQTVAKRWIMARKMMAKVIDAEAEWQEQAYDIRDGKKKSMLTILEERGLVHQYTGTRDEVDKMLTDHRLGAYVGVDPTAASLHVGHMLPLMTLFWMYLHGYEAVTLLGGSTAKIGDPTGRTQPRAEVHRTVRVQNMANMHFQLKKLWINAEATGHRHGYKWRWAWRRALLNNNAWFHKLTWEEALKIIGFTPVSPMLAKRTVKNKLSGDSESGPGLTYAELSYPLMQAWDWWHMYNTRGIRMQIGGSDQYGNITAGVKAVKHIAVYHPGPDTPKKTTLPPFGITTPLLTSSSGQKLGKSAGNAVWLDSQMTSTFDLYKYFLNTSDADVSGHLKKFTFLPISDIDLLVEEHLKNPALRKAQHTLALEFVGLIHGIQAARLAADQHRALFGTKSENTSEAVGSLSGLNGVEALKMPQVTLNNRPTANLQLPRSFIEKRSIGRILYACGLAESASEGHRLATKQAIHIGAGAAGKYEPMGDGAVNWNKVKLWKPEDTKSFLIDGNLLLLRRGKHNIRIIEVVSDEEYLESGQTFPGDTQHEVDLTKKVKEKLPPGVAEYASRAPIPHDDSPEALVRLQEDLEDNKWDADGNLKSWAQEEIDAREIDPERRLKELEDNLANHASKMEAKLRKKQAPKGKFIGHGLPRGPPPE